MTGMLFRVVSSIVSGNCVFPLPLMLLFLFLGAVAEVFFSRRGKTRIIFFVFAAVVITADIVVWLTAFWMGRNAIGFAFLALAVVTAAVFAAIGAALGFIMVKIIALCLSSNRRGDS